MRRRKALQSIAMGIGGVATLSHCNTFIASVPQLQKKDEQFIGLISESILPSKSTSFPTPEPRLEFLVNQLEGGLTSAQFEEYKLGLEEFKKSIDDSYAPAFDILSTDQQYEMLTKALASEGSLGFFMQKTKQWSLRHFITSENYMTNYLGYEFMPNRYLGCVPV